MPQPAPTPTRELCDPLSDVAVESGVRCTQVEQWHLTPPWGIRFDDDPAAVPGASRMHIVIRGEAVVVGPDRKPNVLGPGGAAVFADLVPHTVASAWPIADSAVIERPATALVAGTTANYGSQLGVQAPTVLMTMPFVTPGRVASGPDSEAVLEQPVGILEGSSGDLLELVVLASKLVLMPGLGDRYVACRLAEGVLAKVLQRLAGADSDTLGLFGAFASIGVKTALEAIEGDVSRAWTVGELSELAGMSRRAFVQAFSHTVGVDVADFVAMRRIRAVESLVASGRASVGDAAAAVGFRSRSALTGAVRRVGRFGAATGLTRVLGRDCSSSLRLDDPRERSRGDRASILGAWHPVDDHGDDGRRGRVPDDANEQRGMALATGGGSGFPCHGETLDVGSVSGAVFHRVAEHGTGCLGDIGRDPAITGAGIDAVVGDRGVCARELPGGQVRVGAKELEHRGLLLVCTTFGQRHHSPNVSVQHLPADRLDDPDGADVRAAREPLLESQLSVVLEIANACSGDFGGPGAVQSCIRFGPAGDRGGGGQPFHRRRSGVRGVDGAVNCQWRTGLGIEHEDAHRAALEGVAKALCFVIDGSLPPRVCAPLRRRSLRRGCLCARLRRRRRLR